MIHTMNWNICIGLMAVLVTVMVFFIMGIFIGIKCYSDEESDT